jgi:hypothetical protein
MTPPSSTPTSNEALTALGASPTVRSFIDAVTGRVVCLVGETSSTAYVRLVGADQSQTSMYVHKGFVSIAVPPDRSAHWSALTGASVQQKPATHYLLVRQKQLGDAASREQALEAAVESVEHYRDVHIGEPGKQGFEGSPYLAICPGCFQELSVTDKCVCSDD